MENLVLYRKYRPITFGEVIEQEHIIKTLTHALESGKVAHAYLFCGPRGTGKTTVARLLAKAVNCEKRLQSLNHSATQSLAFEPCNKCSSCVEINEGRAMDLVEIDAASNRGIDEIRELREGIKFAPSKLKYKVFIIDEVHMLTREAFNALLKTLEEPPAHAIFILATTEIHKVLPTIISRCQRFDFHKLTLDKIVERLGQIAKKEGVKVEKSALELIAANAEGAARDAESLLGQVIATCPPLPAASGAGRRVEDSEITLKETEAVLGTTSIATTIEMANFIIANDLSGALSYINKIVNEGYDIAQFAKSLVSSFRKMMILVSFKNQPSELALMQKLVAPELTNEQFKIILEQGKKFASADFIKLIRLFIRAENEIKSASLPQLPLELAIAEWVGEGEKVIE